MNNEFELGSLLKQMADSHRPELPSPGLLWWRAQVLRKQKDKERIERPLMIMRGVAAAACVAAFVFFLTLNWDRVKLPREPWLWMPLIFTVVAALGLAFLTARSPVKKVSSGS